MKPPYLPLCTIVILAACTSPAPIDRNYDTLASIVSEYGMSELPTLARPDFALVLYSPASCGDSCVVLTAAARVQLCELFPFYRVSERDVFIDTASAPPNIVAALMDGSVIRSCRTGHSPEVDTKTIIDAPLWYVVERDMGFVRK